MFHWTIHLKGEQRKNESAVVVGHQIYCFGGERRLITKDHMEVHVFNTVSLCWRKLTPVAPGGENCLLEVPSVCEGHRAVLIEYIVYIWGGDPFCSVLYAFDVDANRWFKPRVSGTVPGERYNHSACVLGKVMYIHGGFTQQNDRTNDMYKLDTTTMVWSLINTRGTPPPASSRHSATIIRTKMFVFGGWRGSQCYNTIKVFDTETNCWLNTPSIQLSPKGRTDHSAFTFNGELYIFGGWNWNQYFIDLWKFSPETFCWKKVDPKEKGPVPTHSMCCCMMGERIIFFGGYNTPDDLYVLDLSPSLKTLCKLAVIQYGLEQSGLPHNIRWEVAAMNTNVD